MPAGYPPITVTCLQCDKSFKKPANEVRRSKTGRHFCSYECHQASQRNRASVKCPVCSTDFIVKAYRLRQPALFCSRRCKAIGAGGGSQLVYCEWCGQDFRKKASQINKYNFCSRPCMGKWQSTHIRGEQSPSWRGGYQPYYGADWKTNRRLVRERDGHACQACNSMDDLEVHHIKPVRLFPNANDANDLANLVTLCRVCHVKADVLARWVFDALRRKSNAFHPLQDDISIARFYFTTETPTT